MPLFYWLIPLARRSSSLFCSTIKEIVEKKEKDITDQKSKNTLASLEVHQKAFYLLGFVVHYSMNDIKKFGTQIYNSMFGSSNQGITNEKFEILHQSPYEQISKDWKALFLTADRPAQNKFLANQLQDQLDFYRKFIIDNIQKYIKLLNSTKGLGESSTKAHTLWNNIQKELKIENMNDFDPSKLLKGDKKNIKKIFNDMIELSSLTNTAKNFETAIKNVSGDKNPKSKERKKTNTSTIPKLDINEVEKGLKACNTMLEGLEKLVKIIDFYTSNSIDDLSLFSSQFPKKIKGDCGNDFWMGEDWMVVSAPKKNKNKNSPLKVNLIKNEIINSEKVAELKIDENENEKQDLSIIKKNRVITQETVQDALDEIASALSQKTLGELDLNSLRVINEMHSLLQSSIESVFASEKLSEAENNVMQECLNHLFLWGSDLNLLIQAISKNDLEAISTILCMLSLNIHTVFEQFMQMEYLKKHQEIYTDSHRLSDLFERTETGKQLKSPIGKLIENIDAASLWTRYVKYFENQYPDQTDRPEMLNWILFSLEISESIQKEPLKLNKVKTKKLIDMMNYFFNTTTLAYKCLFEYIAVSKGDIISDKLLENWQIFLDKAHVSIQKHLKEQTGSTIQTTLPSSLHDETHKILDVLKSIDKDVVDYEKAIKFYKKKSMEFGNQILPIKEAKQQIVRFLAGIKMANSYSHPIFTATHLKNNLGLQWIVEQLLKSMCISNKIPPLRTHNFKEIQQLLIVTRSIAEKPLSIELQKMIEDSYIKANEFNCSIGFNYPHLYKREVKRLSELKDRLNLSQQYIETDETERSVFDEDPLKTAMTEGIEVIMEQVTQTLEDLTLVKNSFKE